MEEEGAESRKEQERGKRRLRDRERRHFMSQDERERHLTRRRKNYQLRRQRAEINRIDTPFQAINGGNQATLSSHPHSGTSHVDIPMEKLAKLIMGTIRLSRVKHLARTLSKSTAMSAEASNNGTEEKSTRIAMSSGLRLSQVKQLVRSKGQQEGSLSQHSQNTRLVKRTRYIKIDNWRE